MKKTWLYITSNKLRINNRLFPSTTVDVKKKKKKKILVNFNRLSEATNVESLSENLQLSDKSKTFT